MNDLEVLKNWHHRRLNETIEEHDMRMDSGPPRNVLAALHRENERENSAMLPTTTSRSSSNGGRGNAAKATRRAEAAAQEAGRAEVTFCRGRRRLQPVSWRRLGVRPMVNASVIFVN